MRKTIAGLALTLAVIVGCLAAASGDSTSSVSVPGFTADENQNRHARTVVETTFDRLGKGDDGQLAAEIAIMTALQESDLRVYANSDVPESFAPGVYYEAMGNDMLSVGIFQQQVGEGFQYPASEAEYVMDPVNSTNLFLDRLLELPQWRTMPRDEAAHQAQDNVAASDYTQWIDESVAIVARLR